VVEAGTRFSAGVTEVDAGGVSDVAFSTFFASHPAAVLASLSSADNEAQALVTRVEGSS
jgi:hypothetical protein